EPAAAQGGSPPLSPTERKAQSILAMEWLMRLAIGYVPGYDVRPAERTIRQAINVPELAKQAIEATSRLPGRDAQSDLANVVLDGQRPADLRILAAENLVRHVQRFSPALSALQVQALLDLLPTVQE